MKVSAFGLNPISKHRSQDCVDMQQSVLKNITNQPSKRPRRLDDSGAASPQPSSYATKDPSYPVLPSGRYSPPLINATAKKLQARYHQGTQYITDPVSSTPYEDIFQLSHAKWGLNTQFVGGLNKCGIEKMYEWQAECLSMPGLLEGEKSIVYTAPTSAGKSLGKIRCLL